MYFYLFKLSTCESQRTLRKKWKQIHFVREENNEKHRTTLNTAIWVYYFFFLSMFFSELLLPQNCLTDWLTECFSCGRFSISMSLSTSSSQHYLKFIQFCVVISFFFFFSFILIVHFSAFTAPNHNIFSISLFSFDRQQNENRENWLKEWKTWNATRKLQWKQKKYENPKKTDRKNTFVCVFSFLYFLLLFFQLPPSFVFVYFSFSMHKTARNTQFVCSFTRLLVAVVVCVSMLELCASAQSKHSQFVCERVSSFVFGDEHVVFFRFCSLIRCTAVRFYFPFSFCALNVTKNREKIFYLKLFSAERTNQTIQIRFQCCWLLIFMLLLLLLWSVCDFALGHGISLAWFSHFWFCARARAHMRVTAHVCVCATLCLRNCQFSPFFSFGFCLCALHRRQFHLVWRQCDDRARARSRSLFTISLAHVAAIVFIVGRRCRTHIFILNGNKFVLSVRAQRFYCIQFCTETEQFNYFSVQPHAFVHWVSTNETHKTVWNEKKKLFNARLGFGKHKISSFEIRSSSNTTNVHAITSSFHCRIAFISSHIFFIHFFISVARFRSPIWRKEQFLHSMGWKFPMKFLSARTTRPTMGSNSNKLSNLIETLSATIIY